VLLIAGGVFAAVKLTANHTPSRGATTPAAAPTRAPNSGPFTGTFSARFGPATKLDGTGAPGSASLTNEYAVRSVCGPNGCVATSAMLSGGMKLASNVEFDQVGDRWIAVTIDNQPCHDNASEVWQVLTLTPAPDGTFAGEYRAASANGCAEKRTVTFTRTGDVDVNSLPDPTKLARRVVSPGEALHGVYHISRVFTGGAMPPQNADETVRTDCLRTGERCVSYFYSKTTDTPMVFSDDKWVFDIYHVAETSPGCSNLTVTSHAEYPLPVPPQNPVTLLKGHGHHEQTGNCMANVDWDETIKRIGD
jgi:hypothetical protein